MPEMLLSQTVPRKPDAIAPVPQPCLADWTILAVRSAPQTTRWQVIHLVLDQQTSSFLQLSQVSKDPSNDCCLLVPLG